MAAAAAAAPLAMIGSAEIMNAFVASAMVAAANNGSLANIGAGAISRAFEDALENHMGSIVDSLNVAVAEARVAYNPPPPPDEGPGGGKGDGDGDEAGRKRRKKAAKADPLSHADRQAVLAFLRINVPLQTSTRAAGKMYERAVEKCIVYGRTQGPDGLSKDVERVKRVRKYEMLREPILKFPFEYKGNVKRKAPGSAPIGKKRASASGGPRASQKHGKAPRGAQRGHLSGMYK